MTLPILLDCDGVLADFTGHLLYAIGSRLTSADVDRWDVLELLDREGLRSAAKAELATPSWWRAQPLMPGARDLIRALVDAQADVVIVTSPWISCVGWESARRDWVRMAWFEVGAIRAPEVIVTSRKELVDGAVFVDDKTEHVEAWAASRPDRPAWLFDAPHNRSSTIARRIRGWTNETIAHVLACAQEAR